MLPLPQLYCNTTKLPNFQCCCQQQQRLSLGSKQLPNNHHGVHTRQAARTRVQAQPGVVGGDVEQQPQQQQQLTAADATLLRLSKCPVCGGTGRVTCKDCSGHGFLPRGGYSKRNPLNMTRAVGEWQCEVWLLCVCGKGHLLQLSV